MKKKIIYIILLFLISFICMKDKTYAKTYTDGLYKIDIKNIHLEIYDEEGSLYENQETELMEFINSEHAIKSIDLDIDLDNLEPSYMNDTWEIETEKNARLMGLNLNLSSVDNIFEINTRNSDEDLMGVVKVDYSFEMLPDNVNSLFYNKYYENFFNSISLYAKGETLQIKESSKTDIFSQPLLFMLYEADDIEYTKYDTIESLAEENSMGIILNYNIMSNNSNSTYVDSSDDVIYYIHNMNDTNSISSYLSTSDIKLRAEDIDYNSVYLNTIGVVSNLKICEYYRADTEDGTYSKIGESNCNEPFYDDSLTSNTIYYYKAKIKDTTSYSPAIKVTTIKYEKMEAPITTTTIKSSLKNDTIKGTTENPKTGIISISLFTLLISFLFYIIYKKINNRTLFMKKI